jgi:hypothetical protein
MSKIGSDGKMRVGGPMVEHSGTALGLARARMKSSIQHREVGEDEFDNVIGDDAQYARVQFWDAHFLEEPEPFEWYYGYEYFRDVIRENIPLDKKVMIVGVGSSHFPEDMVADGYADIVAQDISRVAIAQIQARCKHIPEIKYETSNMTDTNLPAESVFAIIDKGLLDSLLCSATGNATVQQYVNEVERILDNNSGVFVVVSHSGPEDMLPFLEQYDIDEPFYTPWYVDVQAVLKPAMLENEELNADNPEHLYWCYTAVKNEVLVIRKKTRLEKDANKKKKAFKKPTKAAPNL